MFDDDRSYYQRRAEVETELAQAAASPKAVAAHYQLAQAYLDKVVAAERSNGEAA